MAEKNTTQKELTCICCPVGCALTVTIADDSSVTVTGNRCPRGAAYGEKEVTQSYADCHLHRARGQGIRTQWYP